VASGWGTVNAARFVPGLVAATRAAHQDAAIRALARADDSKLRHAVTVSPAGAGRPGVKYLLATGFLPGHQVLLRIDGKLAATLTAGVLGTVTYAIKPVALHLASGWHRIKLTSMLLTETGRFRTG
jgi:hypothetical protein